MDKDTLYFHFSNLGLVLIGILSVQQVMEPLVTVLLMCATIGGFIVSWRIKNTRPPHLDTFLGMLSLASVIVILSRVYDIRISFENILKIFSTALVWLALFQSFGLKAIKNYTILQFISVCLLITSVCLRLEDEMSYILYLAVFLFGLVFAMRLSLICEKKKQGSFIIGDQDEVMDLWHQIRITALMFSFVLIVAAFVYPFVPRFENISFKAVPAILLGIPQKIPFLKLFDYASDKIKEDKKAKKEQLVEDKIRKIEKDEKQVMDTDIESPPNIGKIEVKRFPAKGFDKDLDIFKIDSLTVKIDKNEIRVGGEYKLKAELKMSDGSIIPAARLVDWKASGPAKVLIDKDGNLIPKAEGYVQVSASYMGTFSNDLNLKIIGALEVKNKKPASFYSLFLLWFLILIVIGLFVLILVRTKRLSRLAVDNPKEFIKQIYNILCRALKSYGISKFDYVAHREFFKAIKDIMPSVPEPMKEMTECVLEARFSSHKISTQHSQEAIRLFYEVKDVFLSNEAVRGFWKKAMFIVLMLDVLMMPKP